MPRYRSNRARRVRAYVHRPDDLAPLAAVVRSWLMLRRAM